ncbi:MAG TPA: phage holin family protein [Polyangia bacterium]|nr:phage holin family protein [Polyangia bacterium]
MISRPNDGEVGIVGLLRETAEGLGTLVADHIKLARLELVADVQGYSRGLATMLIAALVLMMGYAFAWFAAAVALGRLWGAPLAFLAIAAVHLVAGGIAVAWAAGKMKRTRLMHGSATEARTSMNALTRPLQGRAS